MDRLDIIGKLILRGSDQLVNAVYQRICADRLASSGASTNDREAMIWQQLAAWAVAEQALSRREAGCLTEAGGRLDLRLAEIVARRGDEVPTVYAQMAPGVATGSHADPRVPGSSSQCVG